MSLDFIIKLASFEIFFALLKKTGPEYENKPLEADSEK